MADFPAWLEGASDIGQNADGENLAVGLYCGNAWLCRLDKYSGKWTQVRHANAAEIGKFDEGFLALMHIRLDDDFS